jgi:3-oxoacyl-[acyl-carrier-protein] synthase II
MKENDSIWITGVGLSTPLGHSFEVIASNLLEGRSGIRAVTEFPVADLPSRIAGRLDRIPCPAGWSIENFEERRPLERVALWSCVAALRDSGLWDRRHELRVGLVLGLGAEWLVSWEGDALKEGTPRPWDPEP